MMYDYQVCFCYHSPHSRRSWREEGVRKVGVPGEVGSPVGRVTLLWVRATVKSIVFKQFSLG